MLETFYTFLLILSPAILLTSVIALLYKERIKTWIYQNFLDAMNDNISEDELDLDEVELDDDW